MKMFGLLVVDAKRKLSTTITATDVANAVPSDPTQCAIAQSLRRHKGIDKISIGANMVYVIKTNAPKTVERYAIAANDRLVIREFDRQGLFPCGYRVTLLPPPDKSKLGARSGQPHGTNVRSGKGNSALNRAARQTPTRHVATPA